MDGSDSEPRVGLRGPAGHAMAGRIVQAAEARFRRNGYGKTTVAHLAGDLGVSTAYVYKFFDSKLAICEAVCGDVLTRIDVELWRIAESDAPAPKRMERLFQALLSESVGLFFNERKLHDMVTTAMDHRWGSVDRHKAAMHGAAARVIADGRAEGVFETETPLEETAGAVFCAMTAFAHPKVLEHSIEALDLPAAARATARLVLAGLRAR